MVGQAVDQGDGARGVGKDGVPVLERQVGGDEQGAVFVTAADEVEEEVGGSGFEPMTRQEASLLFRLVSYRYGRGSILITTNKGIRDWPEVLAGDEVLTTAVLDRLLHKCHVLFMIGTQMRGCAGS